MSAREVVAQRPAGAQRVTALLTVLGFLLGACGGRVERTTGVPPNPSSAGAVGSTAATRTGGMAGTAAVTLSGGTAPDTGTAGVAGAWPAFPGGAGAGSDADCPPALTHIMPCPGVPVSVDPAEEEDICIVDSYAAEPMLIDVFLLVDRSTSMSEPIAGTGQTRWESVRDGVRALVTSPDVVDRDMRIGIQFFGQTGEFVHDIDCDILSYFTLGELGVNMASVADPEHAQAIVDAVDSVVPGGDKPTMPALQGAVQYAKQFSANRGMGRMMVVVLVTDGLPTGCRDPESAVELAEVAEEALVSESPVRTLVVGVGPPVCELHQIAEAGGTEQALLVEQGDWAPALIDTLAYMSRPQMPCRVGIPAPPSPYEVLDLRSVRVRFRNWETPDVVEEAPKLNSLVECEGSPYGGWTFDDPAAPSMLLLCPCTCDYFAAVANEVQYGCEHESP